MRAFIATALAVGLLAAPAKAQDNPACAKFEEPLAYNACLARQGPAAHATRAAPVPRGEARAMRRGPTVAGGGPEITRTRKGRVHAVFTIR